MDLELFNLISLRLLFTNLNMTENNKQNCNPSSGWLWETRVKRWLGGSWTPPTGMSGKVFEWESICRSLLIMTYSCKPHCHVFVTLQPRLGEGLQGFTGKRLIHFGASCLPQCPSAITSPSPSPNIAFCEGREWQSLLLRGLFISSKILVLVLDREILETTTRLKNL